MTSPQAQIENVIETVGLKPTQSGRSSRINPTRRAIKDKVIQAFWQRCIDEHRLDPTRMQETMTLPSVQLREHQDQMHAFLHIARHGLEARYQQVAALAFVSTRLLYTKKWTHQSLTT